MSGPTNPIARTVAAVMSLGTSELGQKKPFQNVTDEDRPIGGASSSILRFSPVTTGLGPITDVAGAGGEAPDDPKAKREREAATKATLEQSAEAERQRIAALPRPFTSAEEYESRQRLARATAFKLGGKRPSQYLAESNSFLGVA